MINEIYQLHKSMEYNGVHIKEGSNEVFKITAKDGFLFPFNNTVYDAQYVSGEDFTRLKLISYGNSARFPVIKIKDPLCVVENINEFVEEYNEAVANDKVKDFFTSCFSKYKITFNNNKKYLSKLSTLLYKLPIEIKKDIGSKIEKTVVSDFVNHLIDLFPNKKEIQNKCLNISAYMSAAIYQSFMSGRVDNHKRVFEILFYGINDKNKMHVGFYPLGRKIEFFDCINNEVDDAYFNNIVSKTIGKCAITGKDTYILDKPFPTVTLPIIYNTSLFTMNKSVPTYTRYGKSSVDLFPVSEVLINKIVNALGTICQKSLENRTWCAIPKKGIGKDKKGRPKKIEYDLLLAWIDEKVDIPDKFKSIIPQLCSNVSENSESVDNISQYEAHTKLAINAFKKLEVPDRINQRILVLTKVDPGKRGIALSLYTDLRSVFNGISRWVSAVENGISFKIPIKFKKDKDVKHLNPYAPSPSDVLILSKRKYTYSRSTKVNRDIPIEDIFNILTGDVKYTTELDILENIYNCVSSLLLSFRNDWAINRNLLKNRKYKEANKVIDVYTQKERLDVLTGISFIQIMLDRLSKPEDERRLKVMRDLGRLLSKVNDLHIAYSTTVVRNSKPANTLGNSLMRIADRNPAEALSRLAEDFNLYYQWGRVNRVDNSYVGMLVAQIGNISANIDVDDLPTKPDFKDKSNLMLGYMEFNKKSKNADEKGEN